MYRNILKKGFCFLSAAVLFVASFIPAFSAVYCSVDASDEYTKPESITVLYLNLWSKDSDEIEAFNNNISEKTGIDIKWIVPDSKDYYDVVANSLNSNNIPDVVLLSPEYRIAYGAKGLLWDMSDMWENHSSVRNSGRLINGVQEYIEATYSYGPDGKKGLYGFTPQIGQGCCTYVKKSWLEAAGYSKEDVENKTLTFDEYYKMLLAMKTATGKSPISSPGIYAKDVLSTMYLPEFYQDASYNFYYDDEKEAYVDGFKQDAMIKALDRIKKAVNDGVIDKQVQSETTTSARTHFYNDDTGVFTYWAGGWQTVFEKYAELVVLNPIKEINKYNMNIMDSWCITSSAKNPEGIYKYFIETMLDGNEIQMAWTKGAGDNTRGYLSTVLSAAKFAPGTDGEELNAQNSYNIKLIEKFNGYSEVYTYPCATEKYLNYIDEINNVRFSLASEYVFGTPDAESSSSADIKYMTADELLKQYDEKVGSKVEEVLASMNDLVKKREDNPPTDEKVEIKTDEEDFTDIIKDVVLEEGTVIKDKDGNKITSDIQLIISKIEETIKNIVNEKLEEKIETENIKTDNLKFVDISLQSESGNVLSIESGKVKITIQFDKNFEKEKYNPRIFHYNSQTNELEEMKTNVIDDNIVFEAEGFSPYIIYYELKEDVNTESNTPSTGEAESAPDTGDSRNCGMWYGLICISLTMIMVAVYKIKKEGNAHII